MGNTSKETKDATEIYNDERVPGRSGSGSVGDASGGPRSQRRPRRNRQFEMNDSCNAQAADLKLSCAAKDSFIENCRCQLSSTR
jgi:hypothetical protein